MQCTLASLLIALDEILAVGIDAVARVHVVDVEDLDLSIDERCLLAVDACLHVEGVAGNELERRNLGVPKPAGPAVAQREVRQGLVGPDGRAHGISLTLSKRFHPKGAGHLAVRPIIVAADGILDLDDVYLVLRSLRSHGSPR